MAVSWRKDGIYGFVVLDNPPVNAISETRQGLLDAVNWAEGKGLNASFYPVSGLPLPLALMPEFDHAPTTAASSRCFKSY